MSFEWLEEKMAQVKDEDVEIHVPTGGDFIRGFAGEWVQAMMWKLYTDITVDLKELEIPYDLKIPTRSGGGVFWYWKQRAGNYEHAVEACQAIDWRAPNNVWRWEMPTTTMINYQGDEDVVEKFGPEISVDVEVTGLLSTRRTELHLLFLPSLVQELGLLAGILDERIFNYDSLIVNPEEVSPEYCVRMVGEVDGKDTKYTDGELWQARTEIWAAMGEPNPKAFTVGLDPKTDTTSKNMIVPLSLMKKPGVALWARISRVAAPRMPNEKEKAREKNPFPFGMNVVSQIWMTKEDALEDVGVESEAGGHPDLPSQWGDSVSVGDFRKWVVKYIQDNYDGQSKEQVIVAVKADKTLDATLSLTAEELVPWIEYVWE